VHSDFLTVGDRQFHYYTAGDGPPVVLLHPSPLSSRIVLPIAQALAQHYRVYAIDTPGYGLSDPPLARPESLDDYLDGFAAAFDALGLGRLCLYGAATGAQFAIAFARRHPERVALMVLDAAGHISERDCEAILPGYFPSVRPQADGQHLATLWQMVHDLFVFFPWCDARPEARLPRDLPPPAVVQEFLLDYLRAGDRYDWAYKPAFRHERIDKAREVRVPSLLVRWAASSVLHITDALIDAGLPPNYEVLRLGPTPAERAAGIAAAVAARYRDVPAAESPPAWRAPRDRPGSRYIDLEPHRLHVQMQPTGLSRPLLGLHAAGGSGTQLGARVSAEAAGRPSLFPDLPGHGESTRPADDAPISVEHYASTIEALLAAVGFDSVDVVAEPLGQCIAHELRRRRPGLIASVRRLGSAPPATMDLDSWLERMAPSLAPQLDGTHLFRAWSMVRDATLWSPWWQHTVASALRSEPMPPPALLHARVVDLMKAGDGYRRAMRAEYEYLERTTLAANTTLSTEPR
jgi:pimeloyl-ACP methyl ester carboxylesterase